MDNNQPSFGLLDSLANLMESVTQTSICLLHLDKDGLILAHNSRGLKLFSSNEENAILSQNLATFIEEDSKPGFEELLENSLLGARSSCLLRLKNSSGKGIPLEASAILVENSKKEPYILLCLFNTDERVWVQEKRLKQREEQIELEQMDSVREFAAGVSHEINNPLTIIKTQNSLIKQKLNSPNFKVNLKKLNQSFAIIDDTVERTKKIIDSLSNFSRKSPTEDLDEIEIKDVLDETLLVCNSKLEANQIKFRAELEQDFKVLAKRIELSQVVLNLINNSFDSIKNDKGEKWIQVSAKIQSSFIQVLFSDSGQKMNLEIAKKIMKPFFTTKEVGENMGLGLSISSSIMKRLNGRIYYEPSGEYNQFVIELLRAKP